MAFNAKSANALLDQLGIRGNLQDLVRKAIIQGWDVNEFSDALIHTKQFKRAFPGLIVKGQIATDFGRPGGAQNLINAVNNYYTGFDDFNEVAKKLGMTNAAFNKRTYAIAVKNGISLDEYASRLMVEKTVKSNPELLDQFNQQLKLMGKQTLDEMGWKKFLAKAGSADLYDAYEAAYLRSQGLDLTKEQAAGVAANIGTPGQGGLDLNQIVQEINRIKPDVAPELARAGITDADLVQLAAGSDPGGKATLLEQIVARRRALQQRPGGQSSGQSSSGGFSLYQEDEAAAY